PLGAQPELESRVRRAGEDGRIPIREVRAQRRTELLHQLTRGRLVFETYAIRRIGREEALARGCRTRVGEIAAREGDRAREAGACRVVARGIEHAVVAIEAAHRERRFALSRKGSVLDPFPGGAIVPEPAEESEVMPACV